MKWVRIVEPVIDVAPGESVPISDLMVDLESRILVLFSRLSWEKQRTAYAVPSGRGWPG